MAATFVIAFREFLEAFLIVGVFFGLSRKLKLGREKEIIGAVILGIIISFTLPTLAFFAGDKAHAIITERNADLLEGYLLTFSGIFLVYVIFSLHKFFSMRRSGDLIKAHKKLEQNIFDLSLFATIVFFIIREGFEIALFTATTSLFSRFTENMVGLAAGFVGAAILGILACFSYLRFSIGKVYFFTEYAIILLGAAFIKNGLSELFEVYAHVELSNILPLHLSFLPSTGSVAGHMIKNITGLEQGFSIAALAIMGIYVAIVYWFLMKKSWARS